MALLGAQLVITLVMVSVIQKIGSHYSVARWLLCSTGLTRYLYPTDGELKSLAGIVRDKSKHKGNGKHKENGKIDTFHVPRNLDIQLETTKVSPLDVVHLRYFLEYQWLLDFSFYSTLVFIISEIYHSYFPIKDDVNLSAVWCFLVIGFAFKILVTLTLQYFRGEESIGERSTCIVSGCTFLLLAMIALIISENNLETGLDKAYDSFHNSASNFLESQGLTNSGPASKLILKFSLAVWCAIIGTLFTFPGLRMARMHWDSLKYCSGNKIMSFLLNLSFALPFLLVLLWIKPLSRDYLTKRVFSGLEGPIMASHVFDIVRLIAVLLTVLLRLALMPVYLQAYLNMAYYRLEEQKKEAGRITNTELQKKIAAVFYYLCAVTLQYIAPLVLCFFLTLMYKTLGGYTWSGLFIEPPALDECGLEQPLNLKIPNDGESSEQSIIESAQQFHLALESVKAIFSVEVFRGLFGFATWWCCFSWFATTSLGMVYQSYFRLS